tara:strand:- start:7723 stop:8235 length:513 start_codon:yes stop_codon:yes gene_type:complete
MNLFYEQGSYVMAKKVAKKKTAKSKGGRPSSFTKSQLSVIEFLIKDGKTDKDVAKALGVAESTYHGWKNNNPEFIESLKDIKDWKIEADKKVEDALYNRAHGYSLTETKTFMHEGCVITEDIIKHYPPDPTSMIFWLKNRQPTNWRDKREYDVKTDGEIKINIDKDDSNL